MSRLDAAEEGGRLIPPQLAAGTLLHTRASFTRIHPFPRPRRPPLRAEKTPYEGGSFRVKLVLTKEYPAAPPKGFFLTKIFHPNVAATGDICVNTLKKDWTPETTLAHVLAVVRCLLIVPFPESSLNDDAGKLFMESYDEYFRRAKLMTSIHAMTAAAGGKPAGAASEAGAAAGSATGGAGTVVDAAGSSSSSSSSSASSAAAVPVDSGAAVTALAGAKAANTSDAAPVAAAVKPVAAVTAPAAKAPVAAAAAKKSMKRL